MKLTYCRTFNRIPYDILSISEAARMHEESKRYKVLFEDDDRRLAEVDMGNLRDGCTVRYFDERRRRLFGYVWILLKDGRVFWSQTTQYIYRGDEPLLSWGKETYYGEDGRIWTREGDRHGSTIRDDYPRMDVSHHYEPFPAFGDYAAFYRLIRHGPPELVPAFDANIVVTEPEPKPKARKRPRRSP